MECHISPINQEYRVAFICQFTLVTSIKSEQERLLHELARLTTLNAIKSKFVNIVSHEFRTNLSIIQSSTEICRLLISEKPIKSNAKVEEHLNVITQEVDRITNLMGEILLITKIEAEHNNTQYEYFNIAKMLNEVLETHFRPWIDNRAISVSYQIRNTPNIVSNKLMITHIIKNLVENAFKYSPNRPSPKCRLKTTKKYWSFTILDYGIGINTADYTSLGTQFFRASNVANIPGTGLGLTTVTYFPNILGATYLIKSTLKKGTVFYLKFPQKKQHAENFN